MECDIAMFEIITNTMLHRGPVYLQDLIPTGFGCINESCGLVNNTIMKPFKKNSIYISKTHKLLSRVH